MKNFVVLIVALTVVGSAMSAYAVEKPSSPTGAAVIQSENGFKLLYKSEQSGDVKVTIYNSSKQPVFTETIRDVDNFARPYNLSTLGQGEYLVELETRDGKKVHRITYEKSAHRSLMKLTRVAGENGKFVLSVPRQHTDFLEITIYDELEQEVYRKREAVNGDFAKVYDLGNIANGFSFQVTGANGMSTWLESPKE